jgi:uncharacterized membrane protein
MAAFHLSWDLVYMGMLRANMSFGPWPWFSRIIAATFLLVAGISLVVSDARAGHRASFSKYLRRGLKVFGFGMVITLITYLFLGRGFVVFGILHLIGFSISAAYPFLPYQRRTISLLAGAALIGVGIYANRQVISYPWLIWLGISQRGRPMVDYYPILPWFGVALVGLFVGHTLYPAGRRRFALPDLSGIWPIRALSYLGRHALLIYLVHQPLLLGVLYVWDWLAP